jgi:hypothetical protein
MISAAVYLMCALTSIFCTVLLFRTYKKNQNKLILWSGVCFICLALNNIMLFVDLVMTPAVDLAVLRTVPAVVGFGVLVGCLVWESP